VRVIDLTEEYQKLYFVCLEDWNDQIKEAGDHKAAWYDRMKGNGLRVKLALADNGQVGGMIQYVPIEQSTAEGRDLYFINCIWVHGYKQGRGNFQKRGMGKALLRAAEDDANLLGAKGMVAWGVPLPFWMKASWFKKQEYTAVDKLGFLGPVLLWKPFTRNVTPPRWIRPKKKTEKVPGKVTVTSFLNGWCPAQNLVFERAKRAASEFGDKVVFQKIDTFDRNTFLEWGISDALFVDNKQVNTGPPPSYDKIRKLIASGVNQL
jgi:GNAT superfamily N-acetyltransferase